jgi:tRNA(Arg) A34 adenosine deaminase TadA
MITHCPVCNEKMIIYQTDEIVYVCQNQHYGAPDTSTMFIFKNNILDTYHIPFLVNNKIYFISSSRNDKATLVYDLVYDDLVNTKQYNEYISLEDSFNLINKLLKLKAFI